MGLMGTQTPLVTQLKKQQLKQASSMPEPLTQNFPTEAWGTWPGHRAWPGEEKGGGVGT